MRSPTPYFGMPGTRPVLGSDSQNSSPAPISKVRQLASNLQPYLKYPGPPGHRPRLGEDADR
jgi:hypothetical protein